VPAPVAPLDVSITYLAASAELGGAERCLLDMIAAVRAERPDWRLSVIVPDDGPFPQSLEAAGVTVTVLRLPPSLATLGEAGVSGSVGRARLALSLVAASPYVLAYAARLRRVLRERRSTIVHSHGLKMHALSLLATVRGAALVWHLHEYVTQRPLVARVLRWGRRRCRAVVANSASVARDARRDLGDVRVMLNAVDLSRFRPDGEADDLDARCGWPRVEGRLRVGLLATFGRWKGHEVFLRALARLPGERVRGYVIGGPIYRTEGSQHSREELERLAETLGILDRVGFTGFLPQPETALRGLDVVVHASTNPEPFGLAIVEAMACGVPVVVSAAGGAAELFSDGEDALGFKPGDVDGLARQLSRLVEDAALRRRLGEAGRVTATRRFDRGRLGRELVDLYGELTGGPA
jgi:glycosyltransferase involved in cell wall biosynthesis